MADEGCMHVIVPDQHGALSLCDLGMLVHAVASGQSFMDAVDEAAIDQIDPVDVEHFERVRQLNATGDGNAYWGF